jgi:hypothetical protein
MLGAAVVTKMDAWDNLLQLLIFKVKSYLLTTDNLNIKLNLNSKITLKHWRNLHFIENKIATSNSVNVSAMYNRGKVGFFLKRYKILAC